MKAGQAITVLVIALEGSSRVAALELVLDKMGLLATRVPAVDGRRLSPRLLEEHSDRAAGKTLYGELLSPTQIGCVLSHRIAYDMFLAAGTNWALILEDDARPQGQFASVLEWIPGQTSMPPTVIELFSAGRVNTDKGLLRLEGDIALQKLKTFPGFTVAYLINRSAAQTALSHSERVASRADWPPWAAEVEFWRTVPNVVHHGDSALTTGSTMMLSEAEETSWAKGVRWAKLITGIAYLRLRRYYPRGPRQYYRHAVMPTTYFWKGRLLDRTARRPRSTP